MMSLIWSLLFLLGTVCACIFYGGDTALSAMLTGAQKSVTLCLSLAGSYMLFLGILGVADAAGLVGALSKRLRRVSLWLFPGAGEAVGAITLNIAANMLGLGNAATPFGLEAMRLMQMRNSDKTRATVAMCSFIAINASSLQLIPTTMISIRAAAGSAHPGDITLPSFLSSALATIVAILLCRVWAKSK